MSEQTAVVSRRRRMVGQVVSNKMDKTAVVAVETIKQHPLYRKTIRTTKRYKAHDENNEAQIGDVVRIEESRPLSREKRWVIVEWLKRGQGAIEEVADVQVAEG
ncbi:MAG: 30S ribosomal protein S17 [Anaerolineae bacterium]|nr:30S ribosomal protein S17 [Anaerolineae bacterium]